MRFTAETPSNGIVERDFHLGEIPGVLWSPAKAAPGAPLVLMGHGGGLHKKTPAMAARARETVATWGFHVVAIDAPGHGERPRTDEDDQARDDMRRAMTAGDKERFKDVSIRYISGITKRAVPEWQATIDALQGWPAIGAGAPVGYGGGVSMGTAIGIPLTAADPRIRAAIFGGGFFVYDELVEAARRITVPVQFLLPWDDEHVDRQSSLDLFDAFASAEKTLHASPGDHRRIRWAGVDDGFLARHLS
ncbi:alpha/beta hydrolase [Actinoplanes sp. NPDC051411]|uniref:dienelactone hydrolase family protein n=1 Tax=Actinoplanes sp. NPDC051411 TaxID=3155522 RepID=UPI003417B6AC